MKSRAVITHSGKAPGGGEWMCSKDGRSNCGHTSRARKYLEGLSGEFGVMEMLAGEEGLIEGAHAGVFGYISILTYNYNMYV